MSSRPKPRLVGVRIDIETKSGTDIKYGSYRYAEDPDFEVLICSYAPERQFPGGRTLMGKVRRLDMSAPDPVFASILTNPRFRKRAFNANFERVALSRWLGMPTGTYIDPENWRCTAVQANVNGIFGTLADVARAVRSPLMKDVRGKQLIKFFSVPMSPRDQKNATCSCFRYHSPAAHPREFIEFEEYCDQDVVTEAGIGALLPDIPDDVQEQYETDQRVNDRGFRHFAGLSKAAVAQVEVEKDRLMHDLKVLTGVDNPNSNQQMQRWLDEQGYPMGSLAKDKREEALADPMVPKIVAQALTMKGEASLSSVAKHKAALDTRCSDGRIRGALQFYGAHTGREAGRGIQPQNLPRYEAPASDRALLLRGKAGREAPRIAKGTVRASIVPARGHVFVVPDYNAIEARCLGWLAGERWVEDEFKIGQGKIYEATAATMFGIPKDAIVQGREACDECGKCKFCEARSKGKVSNLALGYAGGAGALVTMGAEDAGIDIGNYKFLHAQWVAAGKPGKFYQWNSDLHDYPELLRLRDLYRDASPATTRFWKLCAKAWDVATTTGNGARFGQDNCVTIMRDGRHNRMVLPSGRSIWYRHARSHPDPDNPERIDRRTFMGKGKGVGHIRVDTHGGKLTENVTQAVARDVLFDLIMKIEKMSAQGWPGRLVFHVHDEVVLEVPEKFADTVLTDVLDLMSVPPDWAPTLAVKGAGKIMERYGK
jgi:DNA polymerase